MLQRVDQFKQLMNNEYKHLSIYPDQVKSRWGWGWAWGDFNSLVPGTFSCNLKLAIFKLISRIDILSIPCEIVLRWICQNPIEDKLTLVWVMAWCCQAPSHCLSQYWPRSLFHMESLGHNELTQMIFTDQTWNSQQTPLQVSCVAYSVFDVEILTHWLLGNVEIIFKVLFSNYFFCWAIPMKLPSGVCQRTPWMTSQHWFR